MTEARRFRPSPLPHNRFIFRPFSLCRVCQTTNPPSLKKKHTHTHKTKKHGKNNRCDAKCHIHCLSLTAVPEGDWFCSSCVSERTVPFSLYNDPVAERAFYGATNPPTSAGERRVRAGRQRQEGGREGGSICLEAIACGV